MKTTINEEIITYKVEKNEKFGDYRVNKYLNGIWVNQRDNNWSKNKAEEKAKLYKELTEIGLTTMSDNF